MGKGTVFFMPPPPPPHMPPYRKIGGILFYRSPSICYKAYIWYEGISHRYTSPGTKFKVICKGQSQIPGSFFSKDGCFGGISVSQTHLVFFVFFFVLYSDISLLAKAAVSGDETALDMFGWKKSKPGAKGPTVSYGGQESLSFFIGGASGECHTCFSHQII